MIRLASLAFALVAVRVIAPLWCGRAAGAWWESDRATQRALADVVVAFESRDDAARVEGSDRFTGEWALVTHQMAALGLAQVQRANLQGRAVLGPEVTGAARKTLLPEMRRFGTDAWHGEDAMASLAGPHGHAYIAYTALALGVARRVDPSFPAELAAKHDAIVDALERRLLASPTGLIETYPGEAYPTDCAAVAAAIAVHGAVTSREHAKVLARWATHVRARQVHPASGFVYQAMDATTGEPKDAPRGSGTALAAYFAGFADAELASELAAAVLAHEATFAGFGAVREYADGYDGRGDVDSGPVVVGVSVAATGFALAAARARKDDAAFARLFRTTELFGAPAASGGRTRFLSGGPIGNALLLAMLTSGPERAP